MSYVKDATPWKACDAMESSLLHNSTVRDAGLRIAARCYCRGRGMRAESARLVKTFAFLVGS